MAAAAAEKGEIAVFTTPGKASVGNFIEQMKGIADFYQARGIRVVGFGDGQFTDLFTGRVVDPGQVLGWAEAAVGKNGKGFIVVADVDQIPWGRLRGSLGASSGDSALAAVFDRFPSRVLQMPAEAGEAAG